MLIAKKMDFPKKVLLYLIDIVYNEKWYTLFSYAYKWKI